MYNLPIPFVEKGALKTYLHSEGFELDCDCYGTPVRIVGGDLNLSGATFSIDLSTIESQLNTIITDNNTRNTVLNSVLTELETMTDPVTQTIATGTTAGSIPAGVTNYSIINLGLDPNDPNTSYNPMIINGISITQKVISFTNATGSVKEISNSITYNPNGNTLLILYNS